VSGQPLFGPRTSRRVALPLSRHYFAALRAIIWRDCDFSTKLRNFFDIFAQQSDPWKYKIHSALRQYAGFAKGTRIRGRIDGKLL